jgi:MFS family permease
MALGRFGGQAVAARLGPGRLIRGAAVLATLGAGAATLAATPAQAYAGFALLGLGISVLGPTAIAEAGRLSPPGARTRAIARTAVVGFAGFFIGPPIMGLIAELASLRAAVGALGAFTLLAGALSLLLPRRPS